MTPPDQLMVSEFRWITKVSTILKAVVDLFAKGAPQLAMVKYMCCNHDFYLSLCYLLSVIYMMFQSVTPNTCGAIYVNDLLKIVIHED